MEANNGDYYYFNANCGPGGSFFSNKLLSVPSGDFGGAAYVEINKAYSGVYNAYIASPTLGSMSYNFTNSMHPGTIRIGEELYGTTGGWSNLTDWTNNTYIVGGSYYYQTNGGNHVSEPPISAGWSTIPAPGNHGGHWHASCPCGS